MCTLTFIPRDNGYLLAMNRDERIARGAAAPPTQVALNGRHAVYPCDVEGGAWIATNDSGIAFALLNWNEVGFVQPKTRSRGCVVPALIGSRSPRNADATLKHTDLQGILPFRLVGIFPAEKELTEWCWNQNSLIRETFGWESGQWYSSSLSDAQAALRRGLAFARARQQPDRGSVTWLRRLHALHDAEQASFSTCVHRKDVQTLSYTEFICTVAALSCNYLAGSPCSSNSPMHSVSLARH
jgi:hypothetical protein